MAPDYSQLSHRHFPNKMRYSAASCYVHKCAYLEVVVPEGIIQR